MMSMVVMRVPAEEVPGFLRYEDSVLPLLPDHGAELLRRVRARNGQVEVHLLAFPSEAALAAFENDPRRVAAAAARGPSLVRGDRFELTLVHGPGKIRVWQCDAFNILLDNEEGLDKVDLLQIAEVLDDTDSYLDAGRDFVRATGREEGPLIEPALTFYAHREWVIRFVEAISDPFGVAVAFRGPEPIRMDDLNEGEILE